MNALTSEDRDLIFGAKAKEDIYGKVNSKTYDLLFSEGESMRAKEQGDSMHIAIMELFDSEGSYRFDFFDRFGNLIHFSS